MRIVPKRGDNILNNENVGKKLKTLRKGQKLTQDQLAKNLGWSRAAICNYELGRRNISLSHLKQISEYFGVSLDYFGVTTKNEVFELLRRAEEIFKNDDISIETKEEIHTELLKLFLRIK